MLWPSRLQDESNEVFQLWWQHWPQPCQVISPGLGEVWCLSWQKEVQADEVTTATNKTLISAFSRGEGSEVLYLNSTADSTRAQFGARAVRELSQAPVQPAPKCVPCPQQVLISRWGLSACSRITAGIGVVKWWDILKTKEDNFCWFPCSLASQRLASP